MSTPDVASYNVVFIKSAKDHMINIERSLIALSENEASENILNNLYIEIHSLKGSSSVMGYQNVTQICEQIDILIHPAQNYLDNKNEAFQKLQDLVRDLKSEIQIIDNKTNN